jgi:hypothetical protein
MFSIEDVALVPADDGFGVAMIQGRLYGAHYDGVGWSAAQALDDGLTTPEGPLVARTIPQGFAVSWRQPSAAPPDEDVWFRAFRSSGWSAAVRLDDAATEIESLDLASDGPRLVAAWTQRDTDGVFGVFTASFEETWTTPTRLDTAGSTDAGPVQLFTRRRSAQPFMSGPVLVGAGWTDRVPSVDPAAHLLLTLPSL